MRRMKSHVIKSNNIPEHWMTMIWLNIWIYLTRKHNLLRNGQPWELENIHGPGQAPLKIKMGKFLGHSSSKNDALAIAMANGS